jgi:hypothetical protein
MQQEATGERIAAEVLNLLGDRAARDRMKQDLARVSHMLQTDEPPMERAARIAGGFLDEGLPNGS